MAGKKGRSGIKSWAEIRARFSIAEWGLRNLNNYLHDEKVPLKERLILAQPYLLKLMPDKVQIDYDVTISSDILSAIASLNNALNE